MRLGTCLGLFTSTLVCAAFLGCSSDSGGRDDGGGSRGNGTGSTSNGDGGTNGTGSVSGVGGINVGSETGSGGGGTDVPLSCAQAENTKSYIGCEFWPTITFNPVDKTFHFAAVVANPSSAAAVITVKRGDTEVATATVQPGELEKIILPWIDELKGPSFVATNTSGSRASASVRLDDGAYQLTSTEPVTVWQFSPLEFKANVADCIYQDAGVCKSVTNDASLLIPSTAMTGNYRVASVRTARAEGGTFDDAPPFIAITATRDGTKVKVQLGDKADVAAGGVISATAAGGELNLDMNAGDVVQLIAKTGVYGDGMGNFNGDLVNTLVAADKPVQVISGVPITYMPSPAVAGQGYADHIEETLLPAEALGTEYVVAPPTTPQGNTVGHFVRFVGNFDDTTLEYPAGTAPAGAPTTLSAGESSLLLDATAPFVVKGNKSFSVLSVLKGGQIQDPPAGTRGDPSMSFAVATPQYRTQYTFLAPDDYDVSYADIVLPDGANVTIDGQPIATPSTIGAGWSVSRHLLGAGTGGVHKLESDMPVGLQLMGFGHATSYYVPGGLNLKLISEAPPIK